MREFGENNNEDTFRESDEVKDTQGDKFSEDLNAQSRGKFESMQDLEEDSETTEDNNEGLLEQRVDDDASYAEDTEQKDNEAPNLEKMSDDELREKYEGVRVHDAALGDQYVKYDEQIGQLSSDKSYYSEKEWNSYMDEKINVQNAVSARRSQIQSEMLAIEKELDKRKA